MKLKHPTTGVYFISFLFFFFKKGNIYLSKSAGIKVSLCLSCLLWFWNQRFSLNKHLVGYKMTWWIFLFLMLKSIFCKVIGNNGVDTGLTEVTWSWYQEGDFFKEMNERNEKKGPYCGRKYTYSSKDSSTHVLHANRAADKDMWIS